MTPTKSLDHGRGANERVNRLKERCRIEEVAAAYGEVKPSGTSRYVCRCICGNNSDRRPSFMLYPRNNTFHCFACGEHGDAINLVRLAEKLGFKDALDVLEQRMGGESYVQPVSQRWAWIARGHESPRALSSVDQRILNAATDIYHQQLLQTPEQVSYLTHQRGLSPRTIGQLRLGYSDGVQLVRQIHGLGLPLTRLADIGLITGQFEEMLRQRIIFPVLRGEDAVYLIGRATQSWQREVKYLGLNNEVARKQPLATGVARRGTIFVEGAMDFAALVQWGLDQDFLLVGLLGTAFEASLDSVIARMSPDAFVALDQDWAGKVSAAKMVEALSVRGVRSLVIADADRHRLVAEWVGRIETRSRLTDAEREKLPKARAELATMQTMVERDCVRWVNWSNQIKDPGDLCALGESGQAMFSQALAMP